MNRVKGLFEEQKFQKPKTFWEGSGHPNFMNAFVYGKSLLGKSFPKRIGTLSPPNPKILRGHICAPPRSLIHQSRRGQIGLYNRIYFQKIQDLVQLPQSDNHFCIICLSGHPSFATVPSRKRKNNDGFPPSALNLCQGQLSDIHLLNFYGFPVHARAALSHVDIIPNHVSCTRTSHQLFMAICPTS